MDQDTDIEIIDLTPDTIADYGVCGYKDAAKHLELRNKIALVRALLSQRAAHQSGHVQAGRLPGHVGVRTR